MKINQNGQSDEWCGTHITDLDYELRPFFEALKKKIPSLPPVDEMLVDPDLISHFTKTSKKKSPTVILEVLLWLLSMSMDELNKLIEVKEKDAVKGEAEEKKEEKKEALIWEVFDVDVYANDDYHKMPAGRSIDDVKEECIRLGARCFVTKDNCQYYIRSPPGGRKKGRDYSSIKKKVAERKKAVAEGGHRPNGYKSYVCDY